jgi:hypothetical protein
MEMTTTRGMPALTIITAAAQEKQKYMSKSNFKENTNFRMK